MERWMNPLRWRKIAFFITRCLRLYSTTQIRSRSSVTRVLSRRFLRARSVSWTLISQTKRFLKRSKTRILIVDGTEKKAVSPQIRKTPSNQLTTSTHHHLSLTQPKLFPKPQQALTSLACPLEPSLNYHLSTRPRNCTQCFPLLSALPVTTHPSSHHQQQQQEPMPRTWPTSPNHYTRRYPIQSSNPGSSTRNLTRT